MVAVISFDAALFRAQFPEYQDPDLYPDAVLQGYWDSATCFISPVNFGHLHGACRARALNLMTAHILLVSSNTSGGEATGIIASATIDKVSVSLKTPEANNSFRYYLNLSPWGIQLLALLSMKAAGGMLYGGHPERAAMKRSFGALY